MLQTPLDADDAHPPSHPRLRTPKSSHLANGSVLPQRGGHAGHALHMLRQNSLYGARNSLSGSGGAKAAATNSNVQLLWGCLTAHMDELLE
eukprot:scaffold21024_cov51-Isochrysis_galbana.AAC.1